MGAIGRNDPCPCGSGKKFKQCCLGKEPPPRLLSAMDDLRNDFRPFHQTEIRADDGLFPAVLAMALAITHRCH